MPALLISVRFHDGRYHGSGEWPPSPARLFQALVAGAARGENLSAGEAEAFAWLESLDAPAIVAPSAYDGQGFKTYVPNNDLDAVGGDPARVDKIRAGKIIRPRIFDADIPLVYAWTFEGGADAERHANAMLEIAGDLYQLGRGVDMAWGYAERVDENAADARLRARAGILWRPSGGGDGTALACPRAGSLASLARRFKATRERFKAVGTGKKARLLFVQPPKPEFGQVVYNSPSAVRLFDIVNAGGFAALPVERVVALTKAIRDLAAARLNASNWRVGEAGRENHIDKIFIARDAAQADKARRIRITPLPSIGHAQTDRSIRRVLVSVPPDCPIVFEDVAWSFSGLIMEYDSPTGVVPAELAPAADESMLDHYGIRSDQKFRRWRTVTPAALPDRAARRRIDPHRMREAAKGGAERLREHAAAERAVHQALRHAGIDVAAKTVRVQREPFEGRGRRAEAFAADSRFAKERLWHVEAAFVEPIAGPLLIGDGRYLGLGLMAPVLRTDGVLAFAIADGLAAQADPQSVTRALRRAVMARVQAKLGERATLPPFFTGHAADGEPARSGVHEHLAFVFDAPRRRLMIVAPHVLERRDASNAERKNIRTLESAVEDLRELRAGASGMLSLVPDAVDLSDDPLFARSISWESLTPYRVTRHAKLNEAAAALEADLLAECQRTGLPRPRIEVSRTFGKSGAGLFGFAKLTFHGAVEGPLLLGRDRHFGGGLFAPLG